MEKILENFRKGIEDGKTATANANTVEPFVIEINNLIDILWYYYKNDHREIEGVIAMLEAKKIAYTKNRHWFVIKKGKNFCEFCNQPYNFATSDNYCSR